MGGVRNDGIRRISDLRDRCRLGDGVHDGHRCWVWAGGTTGTGQASLWLPALGRRVTLGIAACVLRTGKPPESGVFWHCVCETKDCANPWHRTPGSRSGQMLAAKITRDVGTKARIAASKRAKSSLTDEACMQIRQSTGPLRIVAQQHGISVSHASQIRLGRRRGIGVRGASVFAHGGVAA